MFMNKLRYSKIKQNFFLEQKNFVLFFVMGSTSRAFVDKFIFELGIIFKERLGYLKLDVRMLKKYFNKHSY